MNSVDPSGMLYSRLSCLDPESASKIMGFILIHGPNEADMMSLATAPDAVLHHLISKGKNYSRVVTSSLHSPTAYSPSKIPVPSSTKSSPYAAAVVNGNGPPFASSSSFPSSASSSLYHHADALGNGNGEVAAEDDDDDAASALSFLSNPDGSSPRSSFHKRRSLSLSDAYAATDGLNPASRPWKFDGFEQELLRARSAQKQRLALASQTMSGGTSSPYSSFPFNKYLSDSPRSIAAAAMMMGEDAYQLAHFRSERTDLGNAVMGATAGSRQIYLTFPADSTFREEDVSNYFSLYGPVQDVRIPYQQMRMFGFVTFVHPETVKIILAKGNPHFVCDSRVLVKPYKEKGRLEKKHLMTQHQLERGDLSSCLSPHRVDIRDFDVPIVQSPGPRMFYNNTQDLLMRRKLEEQAEFQQALEMQSRKMANLKLLELKNLSRHQPFSPTRNLSPAAAISSPTHHPLLSPNHTRSMGSFNHEAYEENNITPTLSLPPHAFGNRQNSLKGYSDANNCNEYNTSNANEIHNLADSRDNESIDLVLPDTLDDTISSKPPAPSRHSLFSSAMLAMNENPIATNSQFSSNNSSTKVSSTCLSNMALPKSHFLDDPRFGAAGNRAIEM